ncbi:DUF3164 family protein [Psychromonas sp. MME2]|uniref:DUF3164 family protein n=1 Tax=unclassified Psychromonas TaxID=2614957 RepID=UPI00339C082F
MKDEKNNIPEGYRRNAHGNLVRIENIKQIDLLRDELVLKIAEKAQGLQTLIAEHKAWAMGEINAFVELSANEYDKTLGGKKGNVTLHSFDGEFRINRSKADVRHFDERIQIAKELIDECIHSWSDGANPNLMTMVDMAFKVDKQGNIDVNQVLALGRLDIQDDKWEQAMKAARDAIQVTASIPYLRIYRRDKNEEYRPVVLEYSKL